MQSLKIIIISVFVIMGACKSGTEKRETSRSTEQNELKTTDDFQISDPRITLHEAAFNGDIETVSTLVSQGAAADDINADGHTPLMLAAYNGHTEVVLHLLKTGADVNATERQLLTPLHFATSGPNPGAVEVLLEYGANINAADGIENFTPLMYAAAEGNIEVVKILLQHGADISLTDDDGDTAEAFAIQNNHQEVAKLLQNN